MAAFSGHRLRTRRERRKRKRLRSCRRKVRYPNREDAAEVRQLFDDEYLQVYRCGFCCGYHLGHSRAYFLKGRHLAQEGGAVESEQA
jgi:hypothetical protein